MRFFGGCIEPGPISVLGVHLFRARTMLHRVVVLNHGIKIAEGPPSEVAALSDVVLGYLGQAETV